VSGTLAAVAGTDLSGTYVIGCAWVNGECGDATVDVQIGAAGSSASYTLTDLQAGLTYYVLAWKDLDGDQQVSDGDLIGAALDEAGNVRAFTEGASGATLPVTPKQAPPQPTAVPGELVGLWSLTRSVGTTGLYNSWIFRADGSASNTVVFFQDGACDNNPGTRMDVTGSVALAGNALTFLPSGETTTTYDCSGNPKNVATGYSRERDFTWRVGAGSDGGPSLFLTEDQGSGPIETEFHAD
jgi:hypothetical protein